MLKGPENDPSQKLDGEAEARALDAEARGLLDKIFKQYHRDRVMFFKIMTHVIFAFFAACGKSAPDMWQHIRKRMDEMYPEK